MRNCYNRGSLFSKHMILVIMGVSGSGKSTVGSRLAQDLNWIFYDGDDFHPPENIDKMRNGIALTDRDRAVWLTLLRQLIQDLIEADQSAVIACSALKATYRLVLKATDSEPIQFVYLKGTVEQIQARLKQRQHHFMNPTLLASQFATLEEPVGLLTLDISPAPEQIAKQIQTHFQLG